MLVCHLPNSVLLINGCCDVGGGVVAEWLLSVTVAAHHSSASRVVLGNTGKLGKLGTNVVGGPAVGSPSSLAIKRS